MTDTLIDSLADAFSRNLDGVPPIQQTIRKKAWERFLELGLPNKKLPGYQYFPLNQLLQETFERTESIDVDRDQFEPLIYPDCKHSHIVFVNGQYVPELSDTSGLPKEVVFLTNREAIHSYGQYIQSHLKRVMQEEMDPLTFLNIALIQVGLFVYVPPKVQLTTPIQCLQLTSHDQSCIFSPRILAVLGKHASAQWIHDVHCLKDFESLTNSVTEVILEEGAQFDVTQATLPCEHGWYFESMRASLKKNAKFNLFTSTQGCRALRQDYQVQLLGENASCDLQGLSLLDEKAQSHTNVKMIHKAPNCHSNQYFKGILSDSSRASFEGKIYVHPAAQKTEAYQLNRSLLLSDKAQSNTKPNLEIFADDVSASHGATITQLQDDDLFYLQTRGIAPHMAKRLLIAGFASELLPTFVPARDRLKALIDKVVT